MNDRHRLEGRPRLHRHRPDEVVGQRTSRRRGVSGRRVEQQDELLHSTVGQSLPDVDVEVDGRAREQGVAAVGDGILRQQVGLSARRHPLPRERHENQRVAVFGDAADELVERAQHVGASGDHRVGARSVHAPDVRGGEPRVRGQRVVKVFRAAVRSGQRGQRRVVIFPDRDDERIAAIAGGETRERASPPKCPSRPSHSPTRTPPATGAGRGTRQGSSSRRATSAARVIERRGCDRVPTARAAGRRMRPWISS